MSLPPSPETCDSITTSGGSSAATFNASVHARLHAMCKTVKRRPSGDRLRTGSFARKPARTAATFPSSACCQNSVTDMCQSAASPLFIRSSQASRPLRLSSRSKYCSKRDSPTFKHLANWLVTDTGAPSSFAITVFPVPTARRRASPSPAARAARIASSAFTLSSAKSSTAFAIALAFSIAAFCSSVILSDEAFLESSYRFWLTSTSRATYSMSHSVCTFGSSSIGT
mmetsp:Transcript_112873/g.177596  ORF Transcript_112873/g.177596 Transcript_112873/m.177596 type:complete len:227 (+) Transcript_112873:637-1317(+)